MKTFVKGLMFGAGMRIGVALTQSLISSVDTILGKHRETDATVKCKLTTDDDTSNYPNGDIVIKGFGAEPRLPFSPRNFYIASNRRNPIKLYLWRYLK